MKNKWDFQTVLTVRGVMAIPLLFALAAAAYTETTRLKHSVILYLNSWSATQKGQAYLTQTGTSLMQPQFRSCAWRLFSFQTYLKLWWGSQTTDISRASSCKKVKLKSLRCPWEADAHSNYSQSVSCTCPTLLVGFLHQLCLQMRTWSRDCAATQGWKAIGVSWEL